MRLNAKVALLLSGLLIGGVAGYLTRPDASERTLIFAAAGGILGLFVGFAADRCR